VIENAVLALSAVSAEEVTINTTHLAAVLAWLTSVILAMGGFIAMIFKRNLEQQDKDRAQLALSFDTLRKSVESAEAREDQFAEMLRRNDEQNRKTLEIVADALGREREEHPRVRRSGN
jgi:hypothetical protein